jgi:hypothetical protein
MKMNIKQSRRIQILKSRVERYLAPYFENGITVFTKEMDENTVLFNIYPTNARWFETRESVLGTIGKLGGVKINRKFTELSTAMNELLFK